MKKSLDFTRVIAVINQKGGVGKSTTSVNLSYVLSQMNRKVLVIDMDSQMHATDHFGVDEVDTINKSIYDLFHSSPKEDPRQFVMKTKFGVDLIPSNIALASAESELVTVTGREFLLKKRIEPLIDEYDYIIIDSSPSLGNLTYNVIVASSEIFIPTNLARFSALGLTQLLDTISEIIGSLGQFGVDTAVTGVIANQYDGRTASAPEYYAMLQKRFGSEVVFKTYIPQNKSVENASDHRTPIALFDKNSSGAKAFQELAMEVIAQEQFLVEREVS